MFTGIVEALGTVLSVAQETQAKRFIIQAPFEVYQGQSIAHDGVCLTVTKVFPEQNAYEVTAVKETLQRTTLKYWEKGYRVNLERSLQPNSRLDGHLVQGHVDTTLVLLKKERQGEQWQLTFSLPSQYAPLVIEKGSIAINGVSLTIATLEEKSFSVVIVPYTAKHTNLLLLEVGSEANGEFDVIAKYLWRFKKFLLPLS